MLFFPFFSIMSVDFESVKKEAIFAYDTKRFHFEEIIVKIFDGFRPLSQLHLSSSSSKTIPENFITFENDQSTPFHKTFYNSPHLKEFLELYNNFIKYFIAPLFPAEKKIVFQKKPTFRIQLPNNLCVGQKHRDRDYFHPEGEINFWLPFTKVFGRNGIFLESEPGKGDFHNPGKNLDYSKR